MLFYAKTQNECRTRCAAPCGTCPGRNGERPRVGIHPVWAVAAVCCKVDIPPHLLLPLSTVAVSFAMLPAGLVFAALHGEKGMLYGLLMGAMFFVALWIAALAQGQTEFTSLSAVKGVAMMSAGAIGGYLGIALRERRRRIH